MITSYHAFLLLITSYHTLSFRLETKPFEVGNFKISSQAPIFLSHLITPCHSLLHLITPYPLGWKLNHFHLAILKLVPRSLFSDHILSRLLTPCHTLSPRLERNHFQWAILKLVPRIMFLSHFALAIEHNFPDRITKMSFYQKYY